MMMGSETEFGILGGWSLAKANAIHAEVIRSQVFLTAEKEGVFLESGGRAYVDHGKQNEYSTPEVESPAELVLREIAGRQLMARGAAAAGHSLLCSNVDPVSKNRWGTHENYECAEKLGSRSLSHLFPHLVSRIIYTGAGGLDPDHPGVRMVLSPRASLLNRSYAVQGHDCPSLVFAKPHPYCAGDRLHVFSGESLLSQRASYLKYATTALVVHCLDAGRLIGPGPFASAPLRALHRVNRDLSLRVRLPMADGRWLSALEIQECLLADVARHAGTLPDWAPEAIQRWGQMLQALREGQAALAGQIDWLLFRRVLGMLAGGPGCCEAASGAMNRGLTAAPPGSPAAAGSRPLRKLRDAAWELYVRLHILGDDSLFGQLDRQGLLDHRIPEATPQAIETALREPPPGRPANRVALIRKYHGQPDICVSWSHLYDAGTSRTLEIPADRSWTGDENWAGGSAVAETREQERLEHWRSTALEHFQGGRQAEAEHIYRELLARSFEPAGTRAHLARVLLMTGREAEAQAELDRAWEQREGAFAYVISRLLFLKALLALLAGADARPILGELYTHLQSPGAIATWEIQPVLERVAPRLGEPKAGLMRTLAEALGNQDRCAEFVLLDAWQEIAGHTARDSDGYQQTG